MRKSITAMVVAAGLALAIGAPSIGAVAFSSNASSNGVLERDARLPGDVVLSWNAELVKLLQTPGVQPATIHPTRSYAMLQAAIYDAIVAITRGANPTLASVHAPRDARPDAAAAEAAAATLKGLYIGQAAALDQLLSSQLASIPDGKSKRQGISVGDAVAAKVLLLRANDGSAVAPPPFVAGTQPGNYRPTPPNFAPPVFTNWGSITPFVLKSDSQFRPARPPALTSPAYAEAINEVKSLGQDTSATRTPEQTVIAKFWAPPIWNTWNVIAENAAIAHHTNLERTAHLFAVLDLSLADSSIAMYDAKYFYQLWRPITAIRLADTAGNPAVVGDLTWAPLAVTAADPSYPGAHSTISAAAATVLAAFFGDRDQFSVNTGALPGVMRSFNSYSAAATDAGLSRIFAGQHTRLDHVAGLELGHDVAQVVIQHAAPR
ncbi:MAG TPA: vanadium-dependent haloperoxidase [Candidatus Dormibacteraeota bacterium]|nr:vanadium-dependent haloperoxidase [Candidatus Dormibacteraeota bacterium]